MTTKVLMAALGSLAFVGGANAAAINVWNFDGDLTDSQGGSALTENGSVITGYSNELIGGVNATVATISGTRAATDTLVATNDASANGGGTTTNNYTLVMDVRFTDLSGFVALYAQDETGGTDAGIFVRNAAQNNAIGGKSSPSVSNLFADGGLLATDTWYRLSFTTSVDGGGERTVTGYIDGVQQNTNIAGTGDFGVDGIHWGIDGAFGLFGDNGGDLGPLVVNSFAYFDQTLDANTIAGLGGATADGIDGSVPEPGSLALLGLGGLLIARRRRG